MANKILSVCIPTYNRGRFAFEAAMHILNNWQGDEIEVVVSDNHSEDDTEELLKSIKDSRLRYFRNDQNLGAAYNTHLSFLRATGDFAYLTSDEDDLELSEVPFLLDYFRNHSETAVLIGGGDLKYTKKRFPDAIYKTAFEALKAIGFKTRYMTGIILNRKMYAQELSHITFEESAGIWDAYSFMYAIARLCCLGEVATTSRLLFAQTRFTMTDISNNAKNDGVYYYEPEGRINQMGVWSRAIFDLDLNEYEKCYMVVKVIFDTIELATRFFNAGYVEEVKATVPESDFIIYKERISGIDKEELINRILKNGHALFESLFGYQIEESDERIREYYYERLKSI